MSAINVLMINYDNEAMNTYAPFLASHGIEPCPASTMIEALNMLIADKCAGIVINADDFEYLPYLKVMRALTDVPIGIAVSRYDRNEHAAAISNGANLYRVRYDPHGYRVKGFSDVVKIYLEFNSRPKEYIAPIVCSDVRVLPDTRRVFVRDKEVRLGGIEFNILSYLVKNKGRILTYEQIYINVWGDDYADSSREMLWWHMSMLRKKLRREATTTALIKTKYGVGYGIEH